MRKLKSVQVIKNVSTFNAEIGAIAVEESEENCVLLYQGQMYSMPEDIDTIVSYRSSLLLRTSGGYCYQLQDGILTQIHGIRALLTTPMNNQLIVSYTYGPPTYECYYNLYDLDSQANLFDQNIPYHLYCDGDVIIAYNSFRGEFKRINTDTESLWEFPLSSLGDAEYAPGENDRIDEILGIAHGNLWIYTYFDRLIALDVDTGCLLTVFSTHENDKWRGDDLNVGLGWVYFHQDKNIYGIGYDSLSIIDTKKLCIMEYYNTKEADPTGIGRYYSVFKPLLQGDYFTFIGEKERESGGCGWAGIFDYKARKLVWECEIISQEERRTTGNHLIAPQQLYMSGDKLYIKDFLKNLHIFEREE